MNVLTGAAAVFYILSTVVYGIYLFRQKDRLQKTGYVLIACGLAIHTVDIVVESIGMGYLPVHNLRETLSLASWAVALVYVWLRFRLGIKVVGVYAAPLVALVFLASLNFPEIPAEGADVFKSAWLVLHVLLVFLGEAALTMACGAGVLYLIQENAIKSKKRGFFYSRLPSLEQLDATGYTLVGTGFATFTAGLIIGLIYAKMVWHRFADWDPKEIWSGITWLVYAVLLHERMAVGWRGRRAAVMAIVCFAVLLFSFIGVNFLLGGHHQIFTRWRTM
jgi:cytochrome c-type biogenesis protein CcsB